MEIVGIGSNIVDCYRIGRMIEQHGELFLTRIYTAREIRSCQARKHTTEHFAGLWAAKVAIVNCLGTGWRKGVCWTEMEIRNDAGGVPRLHLCGAARERARSLRIADILITIAHCRAYATGHAIAVSNPPGADKPVT